ncbi:unnamed protein product [Eruca vesicaria subsp. sativa]|uniref:Uncharacterized protein n=1 Tax=Eruca vesicaria subsp. sativa TaxID=29727 RepID=A0ABC8LN51_ERUVS|nr:unnamed protein product [Eruca vesicaria subsp. sativa]
MLEMLAPFMRYQVTSLIFLPVKRQRHFQESDQVNSWQIPAKVKYLVKNTERSFSFVASADLNEKGSDKSSLNAHAISNAASLRTTVVPGSSALDLAKKKLHDSGMHVSPLRQHLKQTVVNQRRSHQVEKVEMI